MPLLNYTTTIAAGMTPYYDPAPRPLRKDYAR